jgi:hypothetical protein
MDITAVTFWITIGVAIVIIALLIFQVVSRQRK